VDEPLRCYRHPDRETYVSCAECGRGICPDCMTFGPVGIRCPDHAGVAARPKRSASRSFRQTRGRATSTAAPATLALIAVNVAVYLATVAQGGRIDRPQGALFVDGALIGALVGEGEWYRLITATFLHGGILHLLFNMVALWWIGSIVEESLGTVRYLLVYFVSGLAGSAGALLLTDPTAVTVGASGSVYGILGALLILEFLRTGSLAGPALTLIVLNLALTFTIPNISVGGHLGGLAGGIVATLAVAQFRYGRRALLGPTLVVLIGVASVAVAYFRVENYTL
jgi:membrane associated rhomboid family serine protease